MVNTLASSAIIRFADRIHAELKQPDTGTERRLFDLYRLASETDRPAVMLAMIGELLILRYRGAKGASTASPINCDASPIG